MLELYHDWDSVCAQKVRFCLAEKRLEWTLRRIDLCALEHLRPEYLKLNPNGVVPTLVHDGQPVIESTIINEYIDEVFPNPPLHPSDPYDRAKMRAWVKWEDDVLHPAIRPASYALMIKPVVANLTPDQIDELERRHPNKDRAANWRKTISEPVDPKAVEATRERADKALDRLEQELVARGPWIVGETFSLADCAIAPMINRMEWLAMAGLWQHRPALTDWIARIKARSAFTIAFPGAEKRLPGPLNPIGSSLYKDGIDFALS